MCVLTAARRHVSHYRHNRNACEPVHLSHSAGQDVDHLLLGGGDHALAVDVDDAVAHPHAPPLSNAPPHQAADLQPHVQCPGIT